MKPTPVFPDVQPRDLDPQFRAAQILADWIRPENRLTPSEVAAERATHLLFVEIARPAASWWMRTLAQVLSTGEGDAP